MLQGVHELSSFGQVGTLLLPLRPSRTPTGAFLSCTSVNACPFDFCVGSSHHSRHFELALGSRIAQGLVMVCGLRRCMSPEGFHRAATNRRWHSSRLAWCFPWGQRDEGDRSYACHKTNMRSLPGSVVYIQVNSTPRSARIESTSSWKLCSFMSTGRSITSVLRVYGKSGPR